MFVICFISQWMKRSKHGLFVFPPKKTLIWRRHCSIDQSCCSMTSKQFLESSSGMKFVYPSVRLANQKPSAFVSVSYTKQIALFPFVCCFCFVRAFSFQGQTKIALKWNFRCNVRTRSFRMTSLSPTNVLSHNIFYLNTFYRAHQNLPTID